MILESIIYKVFISEICTVLTQIIRHKTMTEFWEEAFKDKQEMWGFEPAKSTLLVNDFCIEKNVRKENGKMVKKPVKNEFRN